MRERKGFLCVCVVWYTNWQIEQFDNNTEVWPVIGIWLILFDLGVMTAHQKGGRCDPLLPFVKTDQIQNPPVKITGKFSTYQASLVSPVHGEIPLSSLNWKFKVWVTYLKILYGNLTRSILDTGGLFLDMLYSLLSSNQSYGALMKVIIQQILKSKAIY